MEEFYVCRRVMSQKALKENFTAIGAPIAFLAMDPLLLEE
jgi:hypothetical protein